MTFVSCGMLTAGMMNQLQDNFAALAGGQPGAPAIAPPFVAITGAPPASPAANALYKHPTAGAKGFAVPMDPAGAVPSLQGVYTQAQGNATAGALAPWHIVGGGSEPGFQNSWVNFDPSGTTHAGAAFRKLPSGLVVIKGIIKSGTINSAAFTLPVGFRPALELDWIQLSNGAAGQLAILANGVVNPIVGSNVYFTINCSFMAEQ